MGLIRTMLREVLRAQSQRRAAVSLEKAVALVEQKQLPEAEARCASSASPGQISSRGPSA